MLISSRFIIFDVETNGLAAERHSILSFSALLVQTRRLDGYRQFETLEEFDRFYYPVESYNPSAIQVNGLTASKIRQRRNTGNYPYHFSQDPAIAKFCQKAELGICHNTPFDLRFLKYSHGCEFPRTFCTMRNLTSYCAIPHSYYGIKWPKLDEAVRIICGREDFSFHDSLADCHAVLEILRVMSNSKESVGDLKWSDTFDELFSDLTNKDSGI